jgi:hypothetical protein
MNVPEHCWAISHVDVEVSELILILKMETEEISETFVFISILIRLIARDDFSTSEVTLSHCPGNIRCRECWQQ